MTERATAEPSERLWTEIEARRDELAELVAALVRRPSLLGQEAEIQADIAEHLRDSGLATDAWDLDDAIKDLPNAGDSGVPFLGRPNVTARLAGTGGGRSLILNGHVDVVSPEPIAAWTHDPWAAEIEGDRMYGRGAHDMKAGLAINLFLPRLLRDLGIRLRGDLMVHSVIEEECTGNGALAASRRHQADACVVTEPMGGSFLHAHVGVLWFRVRVEGKSWHAGSAWQGINAITQMVPIIRALEALDAELNASGIHPLWEGVEHPINLNVGVIQGGDWPSTVPGACEIHCRVSFFPGTTVQEMRGRIEATVRRAAEGDPWLREHPPVITYDGFQTAGTAVARDEPFIRALAAAHRRVTGEEMALQVGTALTDQRYYDFAGTPAGCYGTKGGNGHAADEWLDLTSLVPTAKVLGAFLLDWCGVAA